MLTQRAAALDHFRHQMAEDAYRLGKSSILELLDATRARYETQLDQLELVAGLMEAQLRLQAACGEFAAGLGGFRE